MVPLAVRWQASGGGEETLMEGPEEAENLRRYVRSELSSPSAGPQVRMGLEERSSPSEGKRQRAQSLQGSTEPVSPWPALRKVQSETACRACKPAGQGEEASSEGLCGHLLLPQPDARGPAG